MMNTFANACCTASWPVFLTLIAPVQVYDLLNLAVKTSHTCITVQLYVPVSMALDVNHSTRVVLVLLARDRWIGNFPTDLPIHS